MTMSSVKQQIEDRLTAALSPQSLVITDDSALHAGHSEQAKAGESHFTVEIVSSAFEGQARVQRHRLVNQALGDLLKAQVHALAIKAKAPGETV
ncbi:BolA family transcriptional regulator [uncultured Oceanicaulis sp.]|uniref:BolA family protein n=2 Tax=Oceanicaulis TaxID=153232 RepID=UPI00058C216E|nr:BolA family transcriptional regulator [Oceanicaulis sp.]